MSWLRCGGETTGQELRIRKQTQEGQEGSGRIQRVGARVQDHALVVGQHTLCRQVRREPRVDPNASHRPRCGRFGALELAIRQSSPIASCGPIGT